MNRNALVTTSLVALLLSACSNEKPAAAAQPQFKREGDVAPRPAVVTVPAQPYHAVAVNAGGRISGTVQFDGVFPVDSIIPAAANNAGCGASITDKRVERNGNLVSGAVVWLIDIREGRAVPIEKRFEVENEDCALVPRVQVVAAGGTIDVISADIAPHANRIINVGTGELQGVAPFNDNGQVVPFDRILEKPAELEISCELHPWTKAWVVVLDHPYYATTDKSGAFSIDGVPAGSYHLRAWHPSLGYIDAPVTVGSGGTVSVAMKLPGANAAPPAAPESTRAAPKA